MRSGQARGVLACASSSSSAAHAPAFCLVRLQAALEDGPASRSPLARSLNSVTRDVQGAIGSPRASASPIDGRHLGAHDAPADENCHQQPCAAVRIPR